MDPVKAPCSLCYGSADDPTFFAWCIGKGFISLERTYLLGLRQVFKTSWQPVLALAYPAAPPTNFEVFY